MKIAYFDCISGASGDMILGAFLDAGLSIELLQHHLASLKLEGFQLNSRKVTKNGFSATQVEVLVQDKTTERHLSDILTLIKSSDLPGEVLERASQVFSRMAEVEAGIHNTDINHVHLHELGGIDTIVDVIGAFLCLYLLEIKNVFVSPLPLGRGFTRGAHGAIPLPAPATLALLKGAPIVGSEIAFELVTPTGAALLTAMAESFGPIPSMTLTAVGYGAGSKDLPIPNLLRLLIGETNAQAVGKVETLIMLETNIDDLNPQIYEYAIERLLSAGALDVTLTPIQMKKNRPAVQISVLCHPSESDVLEAILFAETSTLGIRRMMVERRSLLRSSQTVETPYGKVRVKIAHWGEGRTRAAPEYEDCKELAETNKVPLWDVYRSALTAAQALEERNPCA